MEIGSLQALEFMKTHVVKTTPDESLSGAIDLMDLYQAHELPVVNSEGILCGMITESDIRSAIPRDWHAQKIQVGILKVSDFMTKEVISVSEHSDFRETAIMMFEKNLKRIPVTTNEGKVIGTLNRVDILQAIFEGIL